MTRKIILWGGGTADLVTTIVKPVLGDGTDIPWGWFPIYDYDTPPHELKEGDILLAMGATALTHLKAAETFPKNLGVEKLRSRAGVYRGATALVTYDPTMVNVDAAARPQIRWDVRLARRLIKTGTLKPIIGTYSWVSVAQFIDLVARYIRERQPVALDLETMGFYPHYDNKRIITYQITNKAGEGYVLHHTAITKDTLPLVVAALQELLNCPDIRLRGANLKFDLNWLWHKHGLTCSNFKLDTMLVGSMLDENRSNSLEWHAKEHTDMGGYDTAFNQKYDKGRMDLVPVGDDLLTYAAGDVDSCLQVAEFQVKQLKSQQHLARLYTEIVHPAARCFEKIEQRGVLVSPERYAALRADLESDIAHSHAKALAFLPSRLKVKHAGKLDLSRGDLVAEYLFTDMGLGLKPKMFTAVKGSPSTAAKHLKMFMHEPEAAAFMGEYRKYVSSSKILSTYVEGFLKHLRPDNRFHASYLLFNGSAYEGTDDDSGTVTGRLTALDPAMQTVPKHPKPGQSKFWAKELRKCFIAPPDMLMWEADFSQGELRVVACVANEGAMLDAYRKGMDLHCLSGSQMADVEYDTFITYNPEAGCTDPVLIALYKDFRQKAKSANFGLLYGMGPEGFMAYARDSYGVVITLQEAEHIHATFFKTYPGLLEYHKQMRGFSRHHGYVASPLGRIRRLPLIRSPDNLSRSGAERQAINSPIQGCLSDLCLFAIIEIERALAGKGVQVIGMIHDALIGYLPAANATELALELQSIMSHLPIKARLGWDHQLEFPADIEVGPDWGSLAKIK